MLHKVWQTVKQSMDLWREKLRWLFLVKYDGDFRHEVLCSTILNTYRICSK